MRNIKTILNRYPEPYLTFLVNATIHVRNFVSVLAKYKSVMLPISARDGQQRDDVVLVL